MDTILAFSSGVCLVETVRREIAPQPVRLQYSAISRTETPLPEGLRPPSLIANRTGSLLVGDLVVGHRSEVERSTSASLQYIQQVAAALPVDQDDERIIDGLVAKRTASLRTRPLRRREGTNR